MEAKRLAAAGMGSIAPYAGRAACSIPERMADKLLPALLDYSSVKPRAKLTDSQVWMN
jgi:hypothetical protein